MMNAERERRIFYLFQEASERAPQERAAFLDEACAGDERLRKEVESLLESDARANDFLKDPAIKDAAVLLDDGMQPPNEKPLPTNTLLQQRYRIIDSIGKGGMGNVYKAIDQNLRCTVAVKQTFATTMEQRSAFEREAQLLANLTHPALPKVMHHFTEGAGEFLVMQFIEGRNLAELMEASGGPFPTEQVMEWADQLLDALEELHSHTPPIIHRDIKPANLKLTPKDKIMLLDFGLAKGATGQMDTVDSNPSSIYGYSNHYAPLEQMRGAGTDARSDLYSLGATLWNLLTGQKPPDALLERVADKANGKADPLRLANEINQEVPKEVAAVLQRAMALNSSDRPSSATEMRRLLKEAFTAKQPEKEPQQEEIAKSKSLKWTIGSVAGVLALVVLIGLLIVLPLIKDKVVSKNATQEDKATSKNPAQVTTTLPGGVTLEMVRVPKGSFMMGSTDAEAEAAYENATRCGGAWSPKSFDDEKPKHQVNINYDFYLGKFEVTQRQWYAVMGKNPSEFSDCPDCPVEQVSWNDAQEFIKKLNALNDGFTYRLPSEAEWEYACRAGTTTAFAFGDSISSTQANFDDRCPYGNATKGQYLDKTTPAGGYQPNDFGLYDMHGNVSEWVQDIYADSYEGLPTDGSPNLSKGNSNRRRCRGGTWWGHGHSLRSARREWLTADYPVHGVGFRVCAVPARTN